MHMSKPRQTKGLINVAPWLPQMRRACSRQIVLDQLDELEGMNREISGNADRKKLIAQLKKDVAKIQL